MMDKTEKNKDYILTKIKYQNFYFLYNGIDEKTGKSLKDIIHNNWKEKEKINEYESLIERELINVSFDLLKKQLKLIYDYLYVIAGRRISRFKVFRIYNIIGDSSLDEGLNKEKNKLIYALTRNSYFTFDDVNEIYAEYDAAKKKMKGETR